MSATSAAVIILVWCVGIPSVVSPSPLTTVSYYDISYQAPRSTAFLLFLTLGFFSQEQLEFCCTSTSLLVNDVRVLDDVKV